jgi:hypothetical protein
MSCLRACFSYTIAFEDQGEIRGNEQRALELKVVVIGSEY